MIAPPAPSATEISARALEAERTRLLFLSAEIRLSGAAVFLAIVGAFWAFSGQASWRGQIPVVLAYTCIAAIVFVGRRRFAAQVAIFTAGLDLVAPYIVSSRAMDVQPDGGQLLAGLTLGLFVIIVTAFGLSLRKRDIAIATVVAMAEEVLLLRQAGGTIWHMLVACGALILAARIGVMLMDKSRRILVESAGVAATRSQLEDTRAQVEQLSRLQKDKDSLVQLIVHDMRGPLSAAIMSLEYLTRELGKQHASVDMLEAGEDALSSSTNVANMITQILDTSKLEEGRITLHLEQVSARELLDSARLQALSRAQSKSISIEIDAPDTLCLVADKRLFPRLLENLVSNALRHTSPEGRILLVAAESGGEIVLSVHNTGRAIPIEERDGIFAKFQQSDTESPRMFGWGLGLYFCRLVTEAHSGRIAVEDVVGWPASFVIRLPPEEKPRA
ncbi:MAG TPA: HAMP domain-containing sensor histidine kinase [Polyangia bacterium]